MPNLSRRVLPRFLAAALPWHTPASTLAHPRTGDNPSFILYWLLTSPSLGEQLSIQSAISPTLERLAWMTSLTA
ncbi:hypothetical protein GGS20DRAFT_95465 [Poronia punctata]|nr:hypothetical protein GGS20DRAFT_95465 [Poronia punctata]